MNRVVYAIGLVAACVLWTTLSFAATNEFVVFAEPCLNVREKPDPGSNVVRCVSFFSKVMVTLPDELEGSYDAIEAGKWYEINYGEQKGYVLGDYLVDARYFSIPEAGTYNNDVRILLEGQQCGSVNYSPDLNWYGVYLTGRKNRQELKKVAIAIKTPNTLIKKKKTKHEVDDTGSRHFFVVKTNVKRRSMFLIGTRSKLTDGEIKGFTGFNRRDLSASGDFLYPEQIKELEVESIKPLYIKARIEAYIDDPKQNTIKKKYEIEIAKEEFSPSHKVESQNLSPDIPEIARMSCCETSPDCDKYLHNKVLLHVLKRNPVLLWYGDIDRDGKMDLLFLSNDMADGGGTVFYLTLFLSSRGEETDFVKKVAELQFGCDA